MGAGRQFDHLARSVLCGQLVLTSDNDESDATEFEVRVAIGASTYAVLSNPFLDLVYPAVEGKKRVHRH